MRRVESFFFDSHEKSSITDRMFCHSALDTLYWWFWLNDKLIMHMSVRYSRRGGCRPLTVVIDGNLSCVNTISSRLMETVHTRNAVHRFSSTATINGKLLTVTVFMYVPSLLKLVAIHWYLFLVFDKPPWNNVIKHKELMHCLLANIGLIVDAGSKCYKGIKGM